LRLCDGRCGGYTLEGDLLEPAAPMSATIDLAVILLLIGCNALLAMGELALVSARRARLAVLENKGVRGAIRARRLAEEPGIFLPTLQAGLTLIGILIGVFGGQRLGEVLTPLFTVLPVSHRAAAGLGLGLAVLLETLATLVLGELVPKQVALRNPERIAIGVAGPIYVLSRIGAPVVWLLDILSNFVLRILGVTGVLREQVTEEELKAVLQEGAEVGVLEEEERDMIERLLRLADKPVRAIMTSRTELVWIDRTAPREEIIATVTSTPHSRFVVCDGAVDNVVGVVQAKDLLDRILTGGDLSLGASLRPATVMPDTVTALDALERLRADPLGMALVMDEYGSFEGVVTAADVLGAIIGEDGGSGTADDAAVNEFDFEGLTPVDELQARLHLPELPAGNYHTLGGLILALLRRVPKAGDRIVFGGWRFEVTAMDGRRVETVRVVREAVEGG
jgi:putative hemolysin